MPFKGNRLTSDHRRRGHETAEGQPGFIGRVQSDGTAHGMGEAEMRLRHVRHQDLVADRLQVVPEIGKPPDMALARIAHLPLGKSLPAPVEGDDGKAPVEQLAHHLEVLFDEFRPALQDADRPLRLLGLWHPGGGPKR